MTENVPTGFVVTQAGTVRRLPTITHSSLDLRAARQPQPLSTQDLIAHHTIRQSVDTCPCCSGRDWQTYRVDYSGDLAYCSAPYLWLVVDRPVHWTRVDVCQGCGMALQGSGTIPERRW
jgi:hypothetical protein